MAAGPQGASRSLVDELLRNHRVMLQVLAMLLTVALVTVGYLVTVSLPRLERYIAMAFDARNAQIATLQQSVDLRGWLATGDRSYLDGFEEHRDEATTAVDELVEMVGGDDTPGLTDRVVATVVARSAWADWADRVVASDLGALLEDHDDTTSGDGHEVADRIRRAISDAAVPRHGVLVTASAGVAERVSAMAHHTELVAKADEALYRAKRDGRDQVATAAD